jgi:hypothetical protein
MNSMAVGGYKNVDATNLRGGYQEPFVVITPILVTKMAIMLSHKG